MDNFDLFKTKDKVITEIKQDNHIVKIIELKEMIRLDNVLKEHIEYAVDHYFDHSNGVFELLSSKSFKQLDCAKSYGVLLLIDIDR